MKKISRILFVIILITKETAYFGCDFMLLKNKRFTAKVVFIIITAFVLIFSIILISETKTHYYVFLAYDDTECIINNVPYVTQKMYFRQAANLLVQ